MRPKVFRKDRSAFAEVPRDAATRRAAWRDFLLTDFGILRLFWKNRAWVSPRLMRMNQPYPADIRRAAALGVKTIITVRHDPRHGGNALVAAECAALGLDYRTFALFSREAPSREALLGFKAFAESLALPALVHCKSGADRAGFFAALFLVIHEGESVRAARRQLSLRHLHIRASKTGILDAVFDAYLARYPSETVPFLQWVAEEYDPEALTRAFRHGRIADLIDRVLLRHE